MFKMIVFFIITLFTQLYVIFSILITRGRYSHLFMKWGHKYNLTPPLFTEVHVLSQKSQRSCMYVLMISSFISFQVFSIGFWKSFDSLGFFSFSLFFVLFSTKVDFCLLTIH